LANAREALKAANDAQNTQERDRLLKILPALMEAAADDRGANMERAREAVAEALKASDPEITARAVKDAFEIVEAAGGADATLQSHLAERRRRWRKKHFGRSAPDHSV
jgi:predicted sugar kinase